MDFSAQDELVRSKKETKMKKLIIAAVATLLGVVANAAAVDWELTNSYQPGTDTGAENYLVYFFDSSTVTRSDALSYLAAGSLTFLSSALGDAQLTDSDGWATNDSLGNYGSGVEVTGYLVILNSDDAASASLAYVTAEVTDSTTPAGLPAYLDFGDQTGTQTASNWVAVPEPTSGLMLLLGMAGLALRRRRA